MKERIFTTKEQGRVLIEAGLPISTAIGFRDKYLDSLHSMEDDAGRIGLIEAVTPDISTPVWDVGTLLNLLPYEIEGCTLECYKLKHAWSVAYRDIDETPIYWSSERLLIDTLFSLITTLLKMDYMSIKQTARIRYKTEDNPPMANVPLIGYSKKYDCWVALVYRKGDNYYTNMECDVEYKTSPPDEYEYVYP